jgi:hypothetical protein
MALLDHARTPPDGSAARVPIPEKGLLPPTNPQESGLSLLAAGVHAYGSVRY